MVFSSIPFLFVFLPLSLVANYLLCPRYRNTFLLIASLFFYYWGEPRFVFVMFISIFWNYLCGISFLYLPEKKLCFRRIVLATAVIVDLALLFYFKYLNFTITSLNQLFSTEMPLKNIVLPIGISFFSFQGLSYVIDVYRQQVKPQKNFIKLGTYISCFPQLIAGPIVRYSDIKNELNHRQVLLGQFCEGIDRFIIGLAKKTIIANTLALQVDGIFGLAPSNQLVGTLWIGAVMYSLQIYYDFSGYSDMAIGLGKMFGFKFLENFDLPYISKTITEFWHRWHISLSTWFRDYVYIPLGGNRKGNVYLHLLVVFFLTGLWHGASWNFVIWGLWHGMFIIIERIWKNCHGEHCVFLVQTRNVLWRPCLQRTYTMLVVLVGWILFRSDTLSYALKYLKRLFGLLPAQEIYFGIAHYLNPFTILVLTTALFLSTGVWKRSMRLQRFREKLAGIILKKLFLFGLLFICTALIMVSAYNPFIYFRF